MWSHLAAIYDGNNNDNIVNGVLGRFNGTIGSVSLIQNQICQSEHSGHGEYFQWNN